MKKTIKIQTTEPDDALRVGDFALLPVNPRPPVITSHPLRNFSQQTWGSLDQTGEFVLKDVSPIVRTFTVRKGTAISWALFAVDPSNVNNINDTSNLTYVWRKDGQPLWKFNRQNFGNGTSFIEFTEGECTEEITGEYTCDVSNQYGTTKSVPFTLEVVDLDNHPRLYKDVLLNGGAESDLDGWIAPTGRVRVVYSQTQASEGRRNTMTQHGSYYTYLTGSQYYAPIPWAFSSRKGESRLWYNSYEAWKNAQADPSSFDNPAIPTYQLEPMPEWLRWATTSQKTDIIPNEDYRGGAGLVQGFFPGARFIDRYNRNNTNNPSALSQEVSSRVRPIPYFTRNRINFLEDEDVLFAQTLNVSDLESMIKGEVGGVDKMTAQFFAYVGIALSRITIRITQNGRPVEYNWLVRDINGLRKWIEGDTTTAPIQPDFGTPIELIPITDDLTFITIEALDINKQTIKTLNVPTPNAADLWAVKEKAELPLQLLPIIAFMQDNNNPIKAFGQTYTNTRALSQLYDTYNGESYLIPNNTLQLNQAGMDRNAYFLSKRYAGLWEEFNTLQFHKIWDHPPEEQWGSFKADLTREKRFLSDRGAEAFFAVGGTLDLPTDTRELRVTVTFRNTSPSRLDEEPKTKGWNESEIYNTLHSVETTSADDVPKPIYRYGDPRCAVTKMKLQLIPNGDIASDKHTTYAIPPAAFTVAGIAKQRLFQDVHDTSQPGNFVYNLIQPEGIPPAPEPSLTTAQDAENLKQQYKDSLDITPFEQLTPQTDNPDLVFSEEDIINLEGQDQALREEGIDPDTITGPLPPEDQP